MSAEDRSRWEARWAERADGIGAPEPYLVRTAAALPPGQALDVACGDGRNALWLAARGWQVTAVDIAPSAIARLDAAARKQELLLTTRTADLDRADALAGLGPFALLAVIRFKLEASQWPRLLDRLAPGGHLILCSFGRAQHARSGFPLAYCLDRAELERALGHRLRCLRYEVLEEAGTVLEASHWESRQQR
jgi:SAM-dependent methyltransferase